MKRVSIAQAKQTLPALVHEAEREGAIELTRRGKPVAYLISTERHAGMPKRTFLGALEAWREKHGADIGDEPLPLPRRRPARAADLT